MKMMKILTIIMHACFFISFVNGHAYLRIPPSRSTDQFGNELPLISQQGSGGYVDQFYFHGRYFEIYT